MKNKGFTLIELLGVIMILAILALITFPPIIEEIKKSKSEIKGTTKVLIIDAAKDYYEDNINNYELIEGVTYCININTLSEQGYLNKKIKDENLNDINTSKNVKLVYHNAKFDYDVVDSCTYYTVTFDANGGNVDIDSKEVIENSVYGTLPTPTRAGYTFMGWNGKNLFNERDWLLAINNATYDSEIGYYVFKVTDARNLYGRPYGSIPFKNFKENTQYTYTVMGHTVGREGANNTLKFYYYYTDGTASYKDVTPSTDVLHVSSQSEKTIATSEFTWNSSDVTAYISHIQLEEGDTATEYEPYYVTSETKVTRNYDHTLKAIWKENE